MNAGRAVVKTVMHGVVGGIRQKLTGGSFKAGFMAAALTQGFSVFGGFKAINLAAKKATNMIERLKNAAAAAIIGGTASVIGGGKFANGAVTAAFSRLFNDLKIVLYEGAVVFGHLGGAVVGENDSTRGWYPINALHALFGLGELRSDSHKIVIDELIIKTTPEQDLRFKEYLDAHDGPRVGIYMLRDFNCVHVIRRGLIYAGVVDRISFNPRSWTNLPRVYMKYLDRQF